MNLFQETGYGSIFYYQPAPNASTDVQTQSSNLFSILQSKADLEYVHIVFKHHLSTKTNDYP